jgi:hypothetical protein
MKARIAKKFTKALRSGEYDQTTGKLFENRAGDKSKPAMCCLGVLCDLHSKETGKKWGTNKEGNRTYFGVAGMLPLEVAKWAGVKIEDKLPSDAKEEGIDVVFGDEKATVLNDSKGFSFRQIADVVEKNAAYI